MEQPNPNTPPAGAGAPPAGQTPPAGTPPATPSKYEQLAAKKGFKSHDDLATSYEALEPELGRSKTAIDKAKKQLESAGYTMDDDGTIKPIGQQQQQGQQQFQQQGQYQQQADIYDPYTGQIITDPMARQLASLPLGQREYTMFNFLQEQRDKQQTSSYQADSEITALPEAKGFEDDLRKAMQSEPLAVRANKEAWRNKLWQVKGQRYDSDLKNASTMGVDAFLNKAGNQGLPATGTTDTTGVRLNPDQEQQFRWYQQNRPGQFKDRKQFAEALSPSGGR